MPVKKRRQMVCSCMYPNCIQGIDPMPPAFTPAKKNLVEDPPTDSPSKEPGHSDAGVLDTMTPHESLLRYMESGKHAGVPALFGQSFKVCPSWAGLTD